MSLNGLNGSSGITFELSFMKIGEMVQKSKPDGLTHTETVW